MFDGFLHLTVIEEHFPEFVLPSNVVGMKNEDLAEEIGGLVGFGMLEIDETKIELGVGVGGDESKLSRKLRLGRWLPRRG